MSLCSNEKQNILVRSGAAESVLLSKVLRTCQTGLDAPSNRCDTYPPCFLLQCWLIVVRLMQDDDENIRATALDIVVNSRMFR